MRAHYQKDLVVRSEYIISGDSLHHLANVVRVSSGDELLLINGNGLQVRTTITSMTKKEMRLAHLDSQQVERKFNLDLALGMPKREALELCLKQAVEIGFSKVWLVKSTYSQMRLPESERINSVMISALEQSNGAYLPIVEACDWEEIKWKDYQRVVMMDSQVKSSRTSHSSDLMTGAQLLIVGPEGGFSPEEQKLLHAKENIEVLSLPTAILRTPTALAVGAGVVLESLLDR